jgi:hypothetical protein
MTHKATLQPGITTWSAISKAKCFCRHVMSNHQRWANQIVCLEPSCTGIPESEWPEGEVAVKQCWSWEDAEPQVAVTETWESSLDAMAREAQDQGLYDMLEVEADEAPEDE